MGRDAAEITPKFVPDDSLLARDNSGGLDYTPRTAEWDDGGEPVGPKGYLSANGGGKGASKDERPKEKVIGRDRKSD